MVGEVELHPVMGEPGATMGIWPPDPAEAAPSTGQFVVTVHLLALSESDSGVKVHGQTLT